MSVKHPPQVVKAAQEISTLSAQSMDLVWGMEPSNGTLSSEVFRLEIIGEEKNYIYPQLAVLYLAGHAGQSEPYGKMEADWVEDPVPVAILQFKPWTSTSDLLKSTLLAERVDQALISQIEGEIEKAQKKIEALTFVEEEANVNS